MSEERAGGLRVVTDAPDGADAERRELERVLEALLFLSSEPVPTADLAEAAEVSVDEVTAALTGLRRHYAQGARGLVLREVAPGFEPAAIQAKTGAALQVAADCRTMDMPESVNDVRLRN